MKFVKLLSALLALSSIAGTAFSQDVIATVQNPWKGFYAGGNLGGAWDHTCERTTYQPPHLHSNDWRADRDLYWRKELQGQRLGSGHGH
jgi:hypothetical protein